jgi:MoaA/NifB/PqqE/SkfB family radical SAM enzyme
MGIMNLGFSALVSNCKRLSRPYKLNFAVTYRCQSRCVTCNIWKSNPGKELTLSEIEAFAKKNGFFKWIELTGGEPFLRGDLADIVKAFRDSSRDLYLVTMPTNSLCSIERIERTVRTMLELRIPRLVITVSLDGYKELHDRLRGVPNSFEKAIAVFKLLREMRKEHSNLGFVFGYTMSKYNKGAFGKTFEEVKSAIPDITYNDFHVNLAQNSGNYYRNEGADISAYGEDAAGELESILSHRSFSPNAVSILDTLFLKKLVYFSRTGKSPMRSRSLELSLFLDSGGDVYPSIMSSAKVGNIKDSDFDLMKILNSDPASRAREAIRNGEEPQNWTSCEAYQAMLGNLLGSLF